MSIILQINHVTRYQYSATIQLNPHELYLIPQKRTYYNITHAEIVILPAPSGTHERINVEGNSFFQVWFDAPTNYFEIQVQYEVAIKPFNPFGFILSSEIVFPFDKFTYPIEWNDLLAVYLKVNDHPESDKFVRNIMSQSKDIVNFLTLLLAEIHQNWNHVVRMEPGLLPLDEIFYQRKGSCRDLSWMLMVMLRNLGIATRFVSGYAYNPQMEEGHELHGWVEIFLPMAGWIGLDPSLGLFTDHHYIPLATSFSPEYTQPVFGSFAGAATSELMVDMSVKELIL